jgi:4-alpha-glucanotransferase
MQDLLGFGSECRMNTPSVPAGNWQFRVRPEHFNDGLAGYLKKLTGIFGRLPLAKAPETEEPEGTDTAEALSKQLLSNKTEDWEI